MSYSGDQRVLLDYKMKILNKQIPSINTYNPRDPSIVWSDNHTAGVLELLNNSNFDLMGSGISDKILREDL